MSKPPKCHGSCDACCGGQVESLQAEVERLTRERDEARADAATLRAEGLKMSEHLERADPWGDHEDDE